MRILENKTVQWLLVIIVAGTGARPSFGQLSTRPRSQSQPAPQPPPQPAPPQPLRPLRCGEIRVTNLHTYTKFNPNKWGGNFVSHVARVGPGFIPTAPFSMVPNQTKWLSSYLPGTFGPDNILEVGMHQPDINNPDVNGKVKVEIGPNLEFIDGGGGREITQDITYDTPFRHHFKVVAGVDCSPAAVARQQPPSTPTAPAIPPTNPDGPKVAIFWDEHQGEDIAGKTKSEAAGVAVDLTEGCGLSPDGTAATNHLWARSPTWTFGFREAADGRSGHLGPEPDFKSAHIELRSGSGKLDSGISGGSVRLWPKMA